MSTSPLHIVPIRHHSPACAAHLLALLNAVKPHAILIEGPCNFDPLIPLLVDPATKAPVAIVSVDERQRDDGGPARRVVSYFPFSDHSPEFVALGFAKAHNIYSAFIDLPAHDRAMEADGEDNGQARSLLTDERVFTSSDYVGALCKTFGCRDGNEVWDHLFETRLNDSDWRAFFGDVGVYCSHIRQSTSETAVQSDGTLVREIQMRALIEKTRAQVSGPIVAIVGGFHADALAHTDTKLQKPKLPLKTGPNAYLIRYGNRQLNSLSGYSAGLPLPGYYDGLWQLRAVSTGPEIFGAYAQNLVAGFVEHLRKTMPSQTPSFPVIICALENAQRLAQLRGRPGPMRDDILDAMRSTLLKGEEAGEGAPVLEELLAWMTGSAIGNVPPSAGSPPLVEAARQRAKSLGFNIDDGQRRNRDLDFYRKERHRLASRFLHGMTFLETGFGQRLAGPDFRAGVDLDRLTEQWSVAWSPMVEARLVELSGDADSLEGAISVAVFRRLSALREGGHGNNAVAAIKLFASACQAGIAGEAASILPFIEAEITQDPDPNTVALALVDLIHLWRGGGAIGLDERHPISILISTAWRRALFLLPNIAQATEERVNSAINAIVTLREVVALSHDGLDMIDVSLFQEAMQDLLNADVHPAIGGAVCAAALLSGLIDDDYINQRVSGELDSAYVKMASRVDYLRGVLSVARELLWTVPAVIDAIDGVIEAAQGDQFIELLPHLRLTFSMLDPRDIDRLAHIIAQKHQFDGGQLVVQFGVTQGEQHANRILDARIMDLLAQDELT